MKAVVCKAFGGPEVLVLREVPDPPPPGAGEVQIRVRARKLRQRPLSLLRSVRQSMDASRRKMIPLVSTALDARIYPAC